MIHHALLNIDKNHINFYNIALNASMLNMEAMSDSLDRDIERPVKLMVVGNSGIGKRSMLSTFFNNKFPERYFGHGWTFQDSHDPRVKIELNDKIYQLTAWDCGTGGEMYW